MHVFRSSLSQYRLDVSLSFLPVLVFMLLISMNTMGQESNMVSRTYHIYPSLPLIASTNSYISDEKMRSFLQSKGISFPPGSDIRYDQSTDRLQVRNTLFNQRLLWQVLIQANMVSVLVKIEIVILEVPGISVGFLDKRNSNFGEYADIMRDKSQIQRYTMITSFTVPILFTQIQGKEPNQSDVF